MKAKQLLIILFLLLIVALILIFIGAISKPKITANAVREPYSEIKVYFCPEGMCMEKVMDLIEKANDIKCAFYDLNLQDMIEKLREKNAQVVIEDSNKLDEVYSGYSFALMHNKFCIFDRETVFTGSMNPTDNDNYYNNNNIVIIKSKALAENYLDEFDELKNNIYGKGRKVKHPRIEIGSTEIENYFCPEDDCKLHVINALKKAQKSVYFMTFSFTDKDIGNLLWNKHSIGVDVKGIFEEKQLSDYSTYNNLKDFSILDNNPRTMHHKVFVIDNETVITGSFNPSQNANERNDENILIIHDKDISEKYAKEFFKLYNYQESAPDAVTNLVISKVVYNPEGKDENNEVVELKNIGDSDILLDYYFLSDNSTNTRLGDIIKKGESKEVRPKFSMKNTKGILILKHNMQTIDYVEWSTDNLYAKEGEALVRKDFSVISDSAWTVSKI